MCRIRYTVVSGGEITREVARTSGYVPGHQQQRRTAPGLFWSKHMCRAHPTRHHRTSPLDCIVRAENRNRSLSSTCQKAYHEVRSCSPPSPPRLFSPRHLLAKANHGVQIPSPTRPLVVPPPTATPLCPRHTEAHPPQGARACHHVRGVQQRRGPRVHGGEGPDSVPLVRQDRGADWHLPGAPGGGVGPFGVM